MFTVAKHVNVARETLVRLAEHKDSMIRGAVAEHHRTPVETLAKLAKDRNKQVSARAKANPSFRGTP